MKIIQKIFLSSVLIGSSLCAYAEDENTQFKIIVDIGSNMSSKGTAILKTSNLFGGDGLMDSVKNNIPQTLEQNLIFILENIESNFFLTKFNTTYTILYGEKKYICEKTIETGFAPGGTYTVNRPKFAFEVTTKACLSEFFNQ